MAQGLPDIIIGGAPRSGTTYLCHVLERHPEAFVATPFIPEPKICMTPALGGPEDYRARYRALFAGAAPGQILVEKTSYYLENEDSFERLRYAVPDSKFIFIVREPLARAWSNYLWSRKNGLEKLPFEEALQLEGRRPNPLPAERAYARPFAYLARGRYGLFARRYLEAFGRSRVLFLLYEDIALRPAELYESLRRFCGIAPRPEVMSQVGVINATEEAGIALPPDEVRRLREQLKPWVEEFRSVSGLAVGPWGY